MSKGDVWLGKFENIRLCIGDHRVLIEIILHIKFRGCHPQGSEE